MKSLKKQFALLLFLSILIFNGCSKDMPTGPNVEENSNAIDNYIEKLNYDQQSLLNVQPTGSQSSTREVLAADTTVTNENNQQTFCVKTTYNLRKNFEDVAILRPTAGIVWPGALVKGNQSLMDGLPEPITLKRSPVTLRIDLPGMGENGTIKIENPSNSNVQAAIDNSLDWWNENAYQEGYVNASSSSYSVKTAYKSTQVALDLGLNTAWATGDVSVQFNYQSSEKSKTVMAVYKQAFYTITFDTPESPDKVFDQSVGIDQVKSALDNTSPPAYVSSVVYGRIIMFRMETNYSATSAEVESAFKYAAGISVDGTLEAKYKQILANSSIEVITLGGNASVASQAVSAKNQNDLLPIIQGDQAVYSKNNPGVPIAYTVHYLKDNSLAKLGYTTDYTASECNSTKTSDDIEIKLNSFKAIKDCDGIEGDGEFSFYVYVRNKSNKVLASYSKSLNLGSGKSFTIDKTLSITMQRTLGNKFTVQLICYEHDKDIFGRVYNDSRMNGAAVSFSHELKSDGTWSDIKPRTIIINPNTDCSTSLSYSPTVK